MQQTRLPKNLYYTILLVTCCGAGFAQSVSYHYSGQTPAPPSTTAMQDSSAARPVDLPPVRISAGDLLEVMVFDTPELSQKSRVNNDGQLQLLVGGTVPVIGLTTSEAGEAIETDLRRAQVLLHPRVSVNVVESSSQTVTVLGEVKNPGSYPIWGQQSVTDLIAAAGGLGPYASHNVTLTRKDSGTPVTINLKDSPNGGLSVLPGDRIVVGRAGTIYILGDVGKPGGFTLDDRVQTTVLQGLALAQGMNRTANYRGALIRQTPGGPQQDNLDFKKILANQSPDPTLRDGDIVYVPLNAAKDWANRGLNSILQMAVGVVIYGRY